jgi:hypothetical protein
MMDNTKISNTYVNNGFVSHAQVDTQHFALFIAREASGDKIPQFLDTTLAG